MAQTTHSRGSVVARVEALVAEARELAALDLLGEVDSVELPRLVNAVEELGRVQGALSVNVARAMEADGGWALSGARTFASWWATRTGHHQVAARREVKLARDVRDHLPGAGVALSAGEISGDHLQALSSHATRTERLREQLRDEQMGEEFLLTHARAMDATSFSKVVRAWAVAADPEAADRDWVEDSVAEHMFLSKTMGGWAFRGWLGDASGVALDEVLTARMGIPAAGDERLPSQRRAAALLDVARQVLDSGELLPGARVRPHVAVTVPFETLERLIEASDPAQQEGVPVPSLDPGPRTGPAGVVRDTLDGVLHDEVEVESDPLEGAVISTSIDPEVMRGAEPATLADETPIPPALLARLVCEGEFHRVIFGPESEILDAGRARRLFSPGQARAVIARDRHCQYPGCHAPPGRGEIHHSVWWYEHHGNTDVKDGVLLCWHHHDWVHQMSITIERRGGRWRFIKPSGLEVSAQTQAA
ncbi:HNH endonuclease signature motif containing protein [Ruania halotolerans]|uniref:HNH endonuclease signature motif containing protein n=1 Tax=Ruania halotolerans TaxID=2897773 RepID=UPI001E2BBBD4|nr:HNH endonuclease signature motif containing protein [Ruania halotolerans]UFU08246.1 HNH endonuclease [Ruania halotolerans]